jgi:ribosomal protein S6-L-glutamate ligase RimK-like protein
VPAFALISSSLSPAARFEVAKAFLTLHDLNYPVVLKPNIGERGSGVKIASNERELCSYFHTATKDIIIQKYVGGLEFGVFYYRHPGEANGQIFSITEKKFPTICGDGKGSIRDLILRDERAVCISAIYLRALKRCPNEVPAEGETIRLTEVGSHCRGAMFLNGAHLKTDALRYALDSAARSCPGFFFGRFNIRAPSTADLQAGPV